MIKYLLLVFSLLHISLFSQEEEQKQPTSQSYFQAEYFYGNVLKHQPNIVHVIQGHPEGVILSWNQKTFGNKEWQQHYNYPDVGLSFAYQNYKSKVVGELYSLYGHYNFYLLNRMNKNQLIVRLGFGMAYSTLPYDKETNYKNISFGTHLNASSIFKLYYQRQRLIKNVGLDAGLAFIHASNSNVKSPNTGLNTWGATVGINYNIEEKEPDVHERVISNKFIEPIRFYFALRGGVNESEIIGSGLYPFFVISVYADKRLNRKSAFQFGTDLFISPFLTDYISHFNINYPNEAEDTSDITRVGLFIGHELFINKLSIDVQLGYYIHYPFPYETRYYERLSLKRYFGEKWFAEIGLKAHAANAETVEFGFGIRI